MTKTMSPAEHHARMVKMAHPDEREDRSLVKRMVKSSALTGKKCGGEAKRAMGGALPGKKKGKGPKNETNILIAPRGGAGAPPAASSAAMPGAGMPMPSRTPVPALPPRPMPAGGPGLGAMPGPMGAKKGGKVETKKRAAGGEVGKYEAGAGSGPGRLEKEAHYGVKPPKVNFNSGATEKKARGSYDSGASEKKARGSYDYGAMAKK